MSSVNVHLHPTGNKTVQMRCNWCGELHWMEPEYKAEVLERGQKSAAEFNKANDTSIKPEDTWTCGRCMLVLYGLSPEAVIADCHQHDVPKERKVVPT